ncbi:MAG: hypothetical protein AB7L65_08875 [Hyphomonadaceae bacterium]
MSADGKWNVTVNSPMGALQSDLTIKTSGDAFAGRMEGKLGAQDISGKVDGDSLTWAAAITQPMPLNLEFNVKTAGDEMSGSVKAGSFGSFPLVGKRT